MVGWIYRMNQIMILPWNHCVYLQLFSELNLFGKESIIA